MCWVSDKLKIKIAKKDIPVWKIVYIDENSYKTECYAIYHRDYYYLKGNVRHSCMHFINNFNFISGYEGFHSYSKTLKPIITKEYIRIIKKYLFGLRKEVIESWPNKKCIKLAKFYIPKGSNYAIDKKGEIISDVIVFDDFID